MTLLASAAAFGATAPSTRYLGSAANLGLKQPIVGMAATPSGKGYWLVAADGGIFTFGDARFYGSTGGRALNQPIVGMAATPTGRGYWLVAADGGIFTLRRRPFLRIDRRPTRSTSRSSACAATPTGRGYWLVASDGGIFTFGDARFFGSTGGHRLNQPIVGMAATPTGRGYWLVAGDGGIFTFGNARFRGAATTGRSTHRSSASPPHPPATATGSRAQTAATLAFGDARPFGTQMAPGAEATSSRSRRHRAADTGSQAATEPSAPLPPASRAPRAHRPAPRHRARAAPPDERRTSGAPPGPLTWDPLLAGYANSWARTLLVSKQFRHQDLGAILVAANGRLAQAGENIFAGNGAAADAGTAHLGLMGSASHRENLLLPQGQLVGIGAVCSGGTLVVVQDFAINMGAPLPPAGQGVAPAQPGRRDQPRRRPLLEARERSVRSRPRELRPALLAHHARHRRHARSSTTSVGRSAPASDGSCSVRTARARRRCSASPRSTNIPRAARSMCWANDSAAPTSARCANASRSRRPRSRPGSSRA